MWHSIDGSRLSSKNSGIKKHKTKNTWTSIKEGCLFWSSEPRHAKKKKKGGTRKENCTSLSTYLTYEVTALGLKCRWKLLYCGILVLWREKGKHKLLLRIRRHFHCFVKCCRCCCCFNAMPDSTGGQNLVDWWQQRRSVYIKEARTWRVEPSSAFQSAHSNAVSIIYSSAKRDFSISCKPGLFSESARFLGYYSRDRILFQLWKVVSF